MLTIKSTRPLIFLTLLLSISSAYAQSSAQEAGRWSLHVNVDSSSKHDAWGIAFIGDAGDPIQDVLMVSLGISANKISSEKSLAAYGRKEINSWYMLVRFSGNYTITPFFEAGFDLGDAMLEDLANDSKNNDSAVDYYFSLGVTYKVNKQFGASVYQKNTYVKYNEGTGERTERDLEMIGVSGYYYF